MKVTKARLWEIICNEYFLTDARLGKTKTRGEVLDMFIDLNMYNAKSITKEEQAAIAVEISLKQL